MKLKNANGTMRRERGVRSRGSLNSISLGEG